MGQRISYFKNNFGKGLKDLLIDNYPIFRQWYLDYDKYSRDEFNEPFGNEMLKTYFKQERDLPADFENLDKSFVDELISEFIGTYYNLTLQQTDTLEFFGPTMSVWRYKKSHHLVSETKDTSFIELWQFITQGRSLKDNLHFNSFTNSLKIGFINRQEYLLLKNKIEFHFGDIVAIRQHYWTNHEKSQLENAISNSADGSYTLAGHNPISSGLEYVLSAISELTDNNKELITSIE